MELKEFEDLKEKLNTSIIKLNELYNTLGNTVNGWDLASNESKALLLLWFLHTVELVKKFDFSNCRVSYKQRNNWNALKDNYILVRNMIAHNPIDALLSTVNNSRELYWYNQITSTDSLTGKFFYPTIIDCLQNWNNLKSQLGQFKRFL